MQSEDLIPAMTCSEELPSPGLDARINPEDKLELLEDSSEELDSEKIRTWLQKITQMQTEIQKKIVSEEGATTSTRVVKYQDLPYMGEMTLDNSKPRRGRKPKKADICHLIYKNYGTIFPGTPRSLLKKPDKPDTSHRSDVQNRIISSLLEKRLTQEKRTKPPDQSEPLNLCIRDLHQIHLSDVKTEVPSDDEVEFVHETPTAESPQDNPYVYWPNGGVFIHPAALQQQLMYYQRLASGDYAKSSSPEPRKLAPRQRPKRTEEGPSEQKAKRNAPQQAEKTPPKRKRSAIFIPPIPSENQTNPATEVSICKFKFTGGAKPSLQEKKMLSVDSGGNFRYYSGTGDKSMRGYEFFPRETLQQQIGAQGSSTGAFLQASGEKIFPGSPMDFPPEKSLPEMAAPSRIPTLQDMQSRQKKRKSRKSLQREKLEQTFKEKGFLIQTQQLESAEGATYCKFRQLRKFTRYLFRSWKDYLPGNVRELQEGEKSELEEGVEPEGEQPERV